ncbi:carbohydrate kinase family protein [Actinacidiphila bryophytorum]|uniref:Sugar or nucleoside kinase, ribokinase family n=1 Tax=Actinacidiphila bryophytorum TaxID=1436133 RepID=A0A9W4MED1_9ACTN|nr:PfkB family carbohydrate kinase [Actinacidiphila bryophytorum]MBM9439650.1 sugar kinase [Actinacidiphila bryophytorum]MBN6542996.1 sugar kinase [Actinacidiphila bryophytorum]CAG7653160.1 Sugar or nucleoside kinase, ribokinase family [Actinacidiphila bryophytorum]
MVAAAVSGAGRGGGLLVVGDVVTDVVARHTEPLAADTDTAARIAVLPGGAGANAACWAARAGARNVRLLARAGTDSAQWHRAALVAAGVEPVLRVDAEQPTAVVIALVDAAAERTLVTDSGAAFRLGPADWDEALLDGVGHVHLSGYLFFCEPGRELAAVAGKAARARGLPVSVDPASAGFLRGLGAQRFLDLVSDTDLLLPNAAEAALLSGADDPAAAAAALSRGGGTVVVTLGAAGALAAREGRIVARAPAAPATAVDSTGAGDAFTGGLLAARLSGADLPAALAAGCRTAAEAVALVGGRPPAA